MSNATHFAEAKNASDVCISQYGSPLKFLKPKKKWQYSTCQQKYIKSSLIERTNETLSVKAQPII